jgi:protein associated with RNAse G/E
MWNPGDVVAWRGIYRGRVWHAQTVLIVKDTVEETVVALLPGAKSAAPEGYLNGKDSNKRRWHFKEKIWELEEYAWHTHRLLILLEPQKYFSVMFFWNSVSNNFKCYYINFQLPFRRNQSAIDTLDLDLDLIIYPDFSYAWKDEDDYQKAIENGIICPEWIEGIEAAKQDVFEKLETRKYPFDGSWLDWLPETGWSPPTLPENWDKI